MLEILVMVAVVKMFHSKAKDKNLNGILWGFIGAASYYIPVLLMSFWILPELVYAGVIPFHSETQIKVTFIGLALLAGVLCCVIAYQILKQQKTNDKGEDALLDKQ